MKKKDVRCEGASSGNLDAYSEEWGFTFHSVLK